MMSLPQDSPNRRAFIDGLREAVPSLMATGAWGLVTGIAIVKAGLTTPQAIGMTLLVYAGSAQLAALPLLAAALPLWTVLLTVFMVNSRFAAYSGGLQPHFSYLSAPRRLLLGYFNGDVVYLFFMRRGYPHGWAPGKEAFFWGLAVATWGTWQVSSLLGIGLAAVFPDRWGVDLAGTLALLPIMIAAIVNRCTLAAVFVACVVALLGVALPYQLGLPLAVLAALIAGLSGDLLLDRIALRRGVQSGGAVVPQAGKARDPGPAAPRRGDQ